MRCNECFFIVFDRRGCCLRILDPSMPGPERSKCSATSPSAKDERSKVGCRRPKPQKSSLEVQWHGNSWETNGKTGILGLDRLKVRWDVALFFLHVIV